MATFIGNEFTIQTEICEDEPGQFANYQFVQLGRAISSPDMESIAVGYSNIDEGIIKSKQFEHRAQFSAVIQDHKHEKIYVFLKTLD